MTVYPETNCKTLNEDKKPNNLELIDIAHSKWAVRRKGSSRRPRGRRHPPAARTNRWQLTQQDQPSGGKTSPDP